MSTAELHRQPTLLETKLGYPEERFYSCLNSRIINNQVTIVVLLDHPLKFLPLEWEWEMLSSLVYTVKLPITDIIKVANLAIIKSILG